MSAISFGLATCSLRMARTCVRIGWESAFARRWSEGGDAEMTIKKAGKAVIPVLSITKVS
jgi:hypothetical protein